MLSVIADVFNEVGFYAILLVAVVGVYKARRFFQPKPMAVRNRR